jgi:hypothetical protein
MKIQAKSDEVNVVISDYMNHNKHRGHFLELHFGNR